MQDNTSLDKNTESFTSYVKKSVAVLRIKCNVFNIISDIEISRHLFQIFDSAGTFPEIKALLIHNEAGCFGEEAYKKFLTAITEKGKIGTAENLCRARQINILNRFIKSMIQFPKLVIAAYQGNVVTPFLGASLAADLRFASEDVSFSLSHTKFGLHPSGALPFFLPKYIGLGKAMDILLRKKEISLDEAFQMGLINSILPAENFEGKCLENIEQILSLDMEIIKSTKKLCFTFSDELDDYFNKEASIVKYQTIDL